jgi:CRISPR-associated protein Cas1
VAFDAAALGLADIGAEVRRAMRDRFVETHLLERCARDVTRLLGGDGDAAVASDDDSPHADVVRLWDERVGTVAAGTSYVPGDEADW